MVVRQHRRAGPLMVVPRSATVSATGRAFTVDGAHDGARQRSDLAARPRLQLREPLLEVEVLDPRVQVARDPIDVEDELHLRHRASALHLDRADVAGLPDVDFDTVSSTGCHGCASRVVVDWNGEHYTPLKKLTQPFLRNFASISGNLLTADLALGYYECQNH